ncbi:hypothetical protein, partial [uncultured Prevotella sp.]|uniref:hypothetical protein n=1 Tax=uncultured Prevotella sp. TaxID=159272 RepID=UPI0027E2CABF
NNTFKVTICDLKNKDRNMANNIDKKEPVAICDQSKIDVTKCENHELAGNIEPLMYMKILNTRILKKGVITLSFLCYLITCGFVPYYYDEATNLCYGDGFLDLFFGWFCFVFPEIFTKIYSLAWFSNITYIVAIRHLIKGNRKHFVLWICITIILSSLLIICPRTETDTWGNIHHFTLTIGYYLRIISFFILFVGGIYVLFKQNSTKELQENIRNKILYNKK